MRVNTCLSILIVPVIVLLSCGVHYVELENTSKRINLNCYSILLTESGTWNKKTYYIPPPPETCTNDAIYTSSNENRVLFVLFNTKLIDWKDEYTSQYLYDIREKTLKWQQDNKKFSRHLSFKEVGVEDYHYSLQTIDGFNNFNVMTTVEYESTEQLWHRLGWKNEDFRFKYAHKYYYEEIRISFIDGPFKLWIGRGAIICNVYFVYIALNKITDSDLEQQALKFLDNIEYTGDYGERIEHNIEGKN